MINVIGAGPIGNHTAYLLSKKGYKVSIYEEHKNIGQPIQCTGILTHSINEIIPQKKGWINNKIKRIKLISPNKNQTIIKLKKPDLIIDRTKFDEYLYNKAINAGAQKNLNTRFIKKDKHTITIKTDNKIITKKNNILIGADGPFSKVRQTITNQKVNHYIGSQVVVKLEKPLDTYEVYFSNDFAPKFFAWIVPESKKTCRIGIATTTKPNECLNRFLSEQKIKNIITHQGGAIPIYNPRLKIESNKTYIIGDAATQLKATTGGGIVPGLKAAKILTESIEKNQSYQKNIKPLKKELTTHLLIRNMMNRFTDKDYDQLIEDINHKNTKNILENTSRDNIKSNIIRLMITNPKLLKYSKMIFRQQR